MIAIESFKRFRKIDLLAIGALVFTWFVITYFISLPNTQLTFMLSLFVTTMFVVFTALFIRKIGAVTLFYLLGALITVPINNLGGLGWNKVIILVIAGIIFELFFLLLKIEIKNISLDVVLGAGFSNASIPFTMLLLIKTKTALMPYVLNFALMAFIVGVMAAIITFLIWYHIKGLKPIIKFEYSV